MLDQFVNELVETFPNEAQIKKYKTIFDVAKDTNPQNILKVFVEALEPHAASITNRDESFMLRTDHDGLLGHIKIASIWKSPECTEANKNAIWAHLNTLYMFGNTINLLPNGLMSSIEKLAEEYAQNMSPSDLQSMNPEALMSGVQQFLNSK
jgi:hypothetical protein